MKFIRNKKFDYDMNINIIQVLAENRKRYIKSITY